MMAFVAYDLSIDLIRGLRGPLAKIRRHDADLTKQLSRAASSVALNLAEGSGRAGADRRHLYRIALGSLHEVRAALDVATAHGWLDDDRAREADIARLGRLLNGLVR
jgi:four helix bundle protein